MTRVLGHVRSPGTPAERPRRQDRRGRAGASCTSARGLWVSR